MSKNVSVALEVPLSVVVSENSKSTEHDNILNEFIKDTKVEITPIYISLFNIILKTGIIPVEWSVGKIRPIYKNKGSTTDPNNAHHDYELSQQTLYSSTK